MLNFLVQICQAMSYYRIQAKNITLKQLSSVFIPYLHGTFWLLRFFGLSLIHGSRIIHWHMPTVVSKHRWIPFSRISFLHSCNVLVESFFMLITYCSTVKWKKSPDGNVKSVSSVTLYSQAFCRTSGGLPPAAHNYLPCCFPETLLPLL